MGQVHRAPLESPFLSADTQGATRQSQQEVRAVSFLNRCRPQRKTADPRSLRGVSACVSADSRPALLLPPHLHRVTCGRARPAEVESTLLPGCAAWGLTQRTHASPTMRPYDTSKYPSVFLEPSQLPCEQAQAGLMWQTGQEGHCQTSPRWGARDVGKSSPWQPGLSRSAQLCC